MPAAEFSSPIRLLGVIVLLGAPPVMAQTPSTAFYKCATASGTPVYQDAPCAAGTELRNFALDPAPISVVPGNASATNSRRSASPPERKPKAKNNASKTDVAALARAANPAERRHVHPGMHEGEVLSRLGPPDMTSGGKGRKTGRWTYLPIDGDPQTITTVLFDYGTVVDVERRVVR